MLHRNYKVHTSTGVELLGNGRGRVLEFLKQCGGNSEEVNTSEGLDLANLQTE